MARWVACWTTDSENHSGVGSNPSGGPHDNVNVIETDISLSISYIITKCTENSIHTNIIMKYLVAHIGETP